MYGSADDELELPMDMLVGFPPTASRSQTSTGSASASTRPKPGSAATSPSSSSTTTTIRAGTAWSTQRAQGIDIGRVIATVLFASRDTALMYYGDEIGMATTPPTRKEDVRIPSASPAGPKRRAATASARPCSGTTARRRLLTARRKNLAAHSAQLRTINVAAEQNEPDSMLYWYQQIIALKKQDPALHEGAEIMLNTGDGHVLSWLRKSDNGEAVVVACNFSDQPQTVSLDLSGQGIQGTHVKMLMKTPGAADPASLASIQLGAYGVYIGQVE